MVFRIVRLEERIVLDAAGAAVLATVSETDAHQAETTKNRDHADTPSTDDASNHDNAPVDALDHTTIDHAVDAPQNAADEAPPSGYTSVLMVADTTENADQLVSATDDHTLIIHYSLSDTSSEALLESIQQALGDNKADSIAFAGGTLGEAGMGIARDTTLSVATLAVSQSQQDFWHAIGSLLHDGGHIDLFCDGIAGDTVSPLLTNQLQSISGQTVDINHSFENGDTFASSSPADETHAIPISQESIDATHFSDQVTAALSEHLEQQTAHDGLNIVLLDTTLPDYTQLAAAAEKDAVVLLYDGQTESADAVLDRVIAYAHDQDSPIDSLSILAHGKTGEFKLGNEWIDAADLSEHAEAWSALNAVMNDDGNIYLFGCSVAQNTAADQALLDGLAQATHTDVFASDDVTGKGGDWVLEAASQGAQAELNAGLDTNLDTTALSNYAGALAPPVIVSAVTVDNDGDGQIDYIRIVTNSTLDDDFSGFHATVAGYTLDATTPYVTNIGGGGANDTTFYIKVNESGTPDTNATPSITLTGNTTLSNLSGENISFTSGVAGNTGLLTPTANTGQWSDGTYAYSENGSGASETTQGQAHAWYDFGLNVPSNVSIQGIEVLAVAKAGGLVLPSATVDVALSWNGGTSYSTSQSFGSGTLLFGTSYADFTLGGSTDTWGRTWSVSDFTNGNFRLKATATSIQGILFANVNVDVVEVKVYYENLLVLTAADANDAPTISDGTFAVNENAANGTAVGTVSASDPDIGDTLSYAITAGNGAGVFAINSSTGQITIANNANLDRETYSSFALTVQASDGSATDTATITVNVNDLNDITPVANDATVALTENSPNGTSVHTVVATDADVTPATLSYSITAGNSAGVFAIDSSTGHITVANNANLNRETYASFALTVQVSDGTHTDTAAITVNVSDVNEFTPVANDATVALAENSANGTSVHTVVATDADATASLTYSITGGNGAGVFAINSGTGAITVANNTNLNRETYASFALTVQVSDGTHTDTATITVNVSDVNEFTPVANDATVALAENSANGTSVHTVVATDADATASLTYSITGGNGAGVFAINSGTGAITVANNTNLNRETYASFALTVQVSDGTHTDTATITVNVSDVNEFTPVANDATVALAENSANGTSVHTVVATDADATASLTYSITGGNGAGVFAINSGTGAITVANNTNLNRETYASFALTVQVSDGTNTDTATITVNVSDVNEFTPVANDATVALAENSANGTSVHTVVATDADATASLTYSITGGNGAGVFAINSGTGAITVANNTNLNRETYASFALTVQVSDGTNTDTATITVNVSDVNEFTPVANDATVALAENSANGTSVHTVVATDADATASLTYSIIGGNGAGVFTINGSTGEITVANNANLNRETYASFALTVQVSDGTNTDTAAITVNVSDVNEFTPVAYDATVALTEDAVNGASVHTVVATDADATASLTYSIIGGNGAGVFAINPSTGQITVADDTTLDVLTTPSYALTVQVTDGSHIDTATITVDVTAVNEHAPAADNATVALAENSANGTGVHTVVASDADLDTLTYTITGGNGAGVFAIDSNTGAITVANNTNLDRETAASFVLSVQVSDGTFSDTATITINVTDVNDSVPVVNDAAVALAENSANGTSVHAVVATDADPTASLTYSIIGGNGAGVFTIDGGTGEITVVNNTNLNRETTAAFALNIQVSDGIYTDTATITVNVTDVNEFTPVANDATVALAENAMNGTSVHTAAATDADATASLTYSIIGGNGAGVFAINPSTGEITVADNTQLNREAYASFALTVRASDGTYSDTATITVNVGDVNEFTPAANDATVALTENSANGTSVHTVVATDADATATLSYSITGGNGAGVFAINSSTGEITVANNTNLDREAYASFALTVQVSDGTNTDAATITVNVTDVNEFTPVANDATVALTENSANGTSVHTVVAADADATATLTYSITGGNGAGVFAINSGTGVITVADNTNLDRETTAAFALTVQVSDGTNTDTATVTVNVTDVNEFTPVANDATVALTENSANGTSVHTVVATDADPGATLSYSITGGNGAGVFTIDSGTGQITVADNTNLDREAYASFALTVQVSDGIHTDTAAITVNVTDVNEFTPVANDATVALTENSANGTSVHTVVATDADPAATLTYYITSGNGAGVFAIDANTGAITVADNTNLDRETTASFALTVQVWDGTNTDTAIITINVTDVNEYTPVANDATVALAENAANGTSVHSVVATDADSTATLTYSITGGNGAGVFAINSGTGVITVADNTNLDRETTAAFALTVQVSDGTNTDTATVTVNVGDVNEFTPAANDATVALTENSANGTSVHTVVATDADATATLSYSITGGNGAGVFAINSSTGEITVANNTNLDREAYASFALTVQVSDGTNTDAATITVNVTDVNEFTPVANDATVALTENSANGTSVHTVVASDADATATLTYSITGGNGAGVFTIDSGTGQITVADNTNLDRETTTSFALTVQVSDGTNTDTATVTVNVSDINEFTPVANDATVALAENTANGTSVHTVVATDADATATLTYSITGGNGAGVFTIDSGTGQITVADNTNLDRETTAAFALTVQVSDGTNTDAATVTVNVTDVNEFTPVANDATVALTENTANGTSVHTVVATDADPGATLSYSITGGNGAGVFAINSSTGEITVANNTNLDRETTAAFALTVQVSDGTNTDAATVTVNVTDVNEFTPVANDATVALAENTANGTSVHTVVATDADSTATLTYSITGGNGAGVFTIDSGTGQITVADNTNLDREAYASFALTVQVSDGIHTDTAAITVNVTDVNEFAPVANDATVALTENSANGTSVHTVMATDADPAATLTYYITSGNGAGVFAIDANTGAITVADNTNLDRETSASFALTVQVWDGTNTGTATITINVTDVNEFTPVANDANVALTENSANGTSVHTVVATDADPGAALSYSITGGNGAGVFAINSSTGEITVANNTNLDREAYASFALTVQVSDGTNTDTATVTVNVSDINEFTPVANDATVALAENTANGTSVHTVVATDADPTATLTFAITGGNGAGVFTIDTNTGEITVVDNTNLDRETTAAFALTVQVSDGANTDTATVTVNVSDVNEFTPVANDATVALAENSANGTSVHTVVATDADAIATLTYSITGGNGAGVFAINPSTGEITVANNTNLDRETTAAFALTVQVSDGTNTDAATVTVNVTDVNEFTPVANDATVALAENTANGTSVHTVVATDADPTATLTYSITGGNGAGVFTINSSTGEITVANNTNLDRETTASFALTVQVSDGTNTDAATITVNVTDVNEFTPVAIDATVALAENSVNGTSVHTVVATDTDPGATLTYSITGGNGAGVFAINSSTGEITVANNTNLDRETTAAFALTVQVSDGTNTDTATVTVNVTDVNDSVPVAIDATVALTENSPNGTSVHTVVATDADPLTTLAYAITGGNDAGVFAIDNATGVITVADNTHLDREAYASFILTVQVSDGTHGDTATITVHITDINDNAPIIGDNLFSVRDDAANATVVGTVAAGDSDPSATHTYAIIGGNDGGVFTIDADTGAITVADHTALDGATTPSYTLTIQVSDGAFTATATITIDVANVNETIPAPNSFPREPGEDKDLDQPEDKIDAPIEVLQEVKDPESTTIPNAMEVIHEAFTEQDGDPAMQNQDATLSQTESKFRSIVFARPDSQGIDDNGIGFANGPSTSYKNHMASSNPEETDILNTTHVEMWSSADSGEKQSDSIFANIFTGLSTLVAGYVGWVNGIASMMFGFFTSAPLWKSFDPVPIFDAERAKKLLGQGLQGNEEQKCDAGVNSLFDNKDQP